jgi:hypothetical protein
MLDARWCGRSAVHAVDPTLWKLFAKRRSTLSNSTCLSWQGQKKFVSRRAVCCANPPCSFWVEQPGVLFLLHALLYQHQFLEAWLVGSTQPPVSSRGGNHSKSEHASK